MAGLGLVKKKVEEVTIEKLCDLFPQKKRTINQKTVDIINSAASDPEFDGASLMDTMVTYQNVMFKNKGTIENYLNAIRFCSLIEAGDDNIVETYKKVFYMRDFVKERKDLPTDSVGYKELTSAASKYRRSPMVIDILTQADVPLYLMMQGDRVAMAALLVREANTAPLAKDRIAAADKFLTHVKPPENIQIEMDIGVKESNIIEDYEKVMAQMVAKQKELVESGADLKAITNTPIKITNSSEEVIDAEVSETVEHKEFEL